MANVPKTSAPDDNTPAAAPAPRSTTAPRWYRSKGPTMRIPRTGGDFTLNQGKLFNGADYDVEMIRNLGVKLEECDPPGWWLKAQGKGVEPPAAA